MSLATIRSFAFSGIEAVPVEVQVQIASGLPAFLMAGTGYTGRTRLGEAQALRACARMPFAFRKKKCSLRS